ARRSHAAAELSRSGPLSQSSAGSDYSGAADVLGLVCPVPRRLDGQPACRGRMVLGALGGGMALADDGRSASLSPRFDCAAPSFSSKPLAVGGGRPVPVRAVSRPYALARATGVVGHAGVDVGRPAGLARPRPLVGHLVHGRSPCSAGDYRPASGVVVSNSIARSIGMRAFPVPMRSVSKSLRVSASRYASASSSQGYWDVAGRYS